jgi:hypothetical protein
MRQSEHHSLPLSVPGGFPSESVQATSCFSASPRTSSAASQQGHDNQPASRSLHPLRGRRRCERGVGDAAWRGPASCLWRVDPRGVAQRPRLFWPLYPRSAAWHRPSAFGVRATYARAARSQPPWLGRCRARDACGCDRLATRAERARRTRADRSSCGGFHRAASSRRWRNRRAARSSAARRARSSRLRHARA